MSKASKRQRKQQAKNRKNRTTYIYGSTADKVTSLEVTVDETGKISFGPSMVNCYSEVSYAKENGKGEKIVHRIYQDEEFLSFDSDTEVFDKHNRIIAVDTNQKNYRDIWISSTVALELKFSHNIDNGKFYKNIFMPSVIRIGIEKITEKEGWYNILKVLFTSNVINTNERTALIIDSHLDELRAINSRNTPVYNNFYLPAKFKMLYASSDTGGEYLINRLIRLADRLSSQYIDAIKEHGEQWIESVKYDKQNRLYIANCESVNALTANQEGNVNVRVNISPLE